MAGGSHPDEPYPETMWKICGGTQTVRGTVDDVVLSSASVCIDLGYLCADLQRTGSLRILRWPEDTDRIRIRIPLPPRVAPVRAHELQSAAVRGIQYW